MLSAEEKGCLKQSKQNNTVQVQSVHRASYGSLSKESDDYLNKYLDSTMTTMTLHKIELATKISLLVNIILFLIKIAVFIDTSSFAVIAALTDSFCDLVSQMILFYTQKAVQKQKDKFPAGRTRLEPVGILIMSILMIILSCSVVFASLFTIYNTYILNSGFTVGYSLWSVLLLVVSIVLKFCLWLYCKQFVTSPSAMALAEDHRNDVLSNGTALIAVCIASQFHSAVWVDPVGGALISIYIIYSWYNIGIEESNKLIGMKGDKEDMDMLHTFIKDALHIKKYTLNGYYIGRNMLIELRYIHNKCNEYKTLCDMSINIQRKLETFEFVERAFVNSDYMKRNKSLHKIPVLN